MSYQEFPPTLMILSPRLTKAGDPASSVVGINTTPLADGALVYCLENQRPYKLNKQSTATPDGTVVLAPLYGPGRWSLTTAADIAYDDSLSPPPLGVDNVQDAIDVLKGGFTTPTFANPQALAAFDATGVQNFTVVEVGVVNDSYRLITAPSAALLAAADGLNVITPVAPAGVVFERLYVPNQEAWYQTTWTIDPVAGDDRSAGTALAPLKTLQEWCNRMQNGVVKQDVTVTVLAGTANTKPLHLRIRISYADSAIIRIIGTVTPDGGHTVTAVTASVPTTSAGTNVRGFITSADNFTNKSRLRFTSGARNGYTCQVTGFNVPSTSAFISTPAILSNLHPPNSITVSSGFPAINDTYVVETLNTDLDTSDMNIEVDGSGRLIFENLNLRNLQPNLPVLRGGNPGNFCSSILFYNCIAPSAGEFIWVSDSQCSFVGCAFDSFFASANHSVVFVRACTFRLVSGSGLSCQAVEGGYIQFNGPNCFDSGGVNIDDGFIEFNGGSGGDAQWCDGPSGTGFQTFGRVYVHQGFLIWGGSANSGNNFARFLKVFSGIGVYGTTGSPPTVGPNVTSDTLIGTAALSYAQVSAGYVNTVNLAAYSVITG